MRGDLSEQELRTRFHHRIVAYLAELITQASSIRLWPTLLIYTAGQPGAGKTQANKRAIRTYPSLVPVVGDSLRRFHPDYESLMNEDPTAMPETTAQAAGRWVEISAEYLRERRADILIETTLRSPGDTEHQRQTLASLRAKLESASSVVP